MKAPTDCRLWHHAEDVAALGWTALFELVANYANGSHDAACLLKCRECGQLYFHRFHEEVDWDDGDDPQCWWWIPVESEAETAALRTASLLGLSQFTPRLQRDYPKGATAPTAHWIK